MTAAALGATYAAPYLGRMSDAGRDGRGSCVAMQRIIDTSRSRMRLLVASIRDVEDISFLANQVRALWEEVVKSFAATM